MRKLKTAKKSNIKLIGAHTDVVSRRKRPVVVTTTVTAVTDSKHQSYTGWCGCFHKHSNRVVAVFIKRGNRAIPFSAAHGTCSA